jgi:hypothetical protein
MSCLLALPLLLDPAFGGGVDERGGVAERAAGRPLPPPIAPRPEDPAALPLAGAPRPLGDPTRSRCSVSVSFLQQAARALPKAVGLAGAVGLGIAGAGAAATVGFTAG